MSTVRAVQTFHAAIKGGRPVTVTEGDIFDAKHPIVKGRERLFEPTDKPAKPEIVHTAVEQATAAPGELRTVPKKDAADATEVV